MALHEKLSLYEKLAEIERINFYRRHHKSHLEAVKEISKTIEERDENISEEDKRFVHHLRLSIFDGHKETILMRYASSKDEKEKNIVDSFRGLGKGNNGAYKKD